MRRTVRVPPGVQERIDFKEHPYCRDEHCSSGGDVGDSPVSGEFITFTLQAAIGRLHTLSCSAS